MEKLFRRAYITAERIKESSGDLTEALRNTSETFKKYGSISQASRACMAGLKLITQYNDQLNQNFLEDVKGMVDFIHKDDSNLYHLSRTNPRFQQLIGDIDNAHYVKNIKNETLVDGPQPKQLE
jgi:hypothetical protein